MFVARRLRSRWLVLSIGAVTLVMAPRPAQAQFDGGMGFFGFHQVPSPTNYLNSAALTAAARGQTGVPTRTPYANNPNSFINRLRDPGFVSHYDTRGRRAAFIPTAIDSRGGDAQPAAITGASVLAANAILPLANFFDASKTLVWPGGSPTGGELKEKREVSDQASLAVLEETKQQPTASLSSAAFARKKLLAYGQPALQELRATSTPAIADSFHMFLLSLYDSLAQAADPPKEIPPAPPPR